MILKGLGIQSTSSVVIIQATTTITTHNNKSESGFVANNTPALGPAEVFRGDASSQSRVFFSLRTNDTVIRFLRVEGVVFFYWLFFNCLNFVKIQNLGFEESK